MLATKSDKIIPRTVIAQPPTCDENHNHGAFVYIVRWFFSIQTYTPILAAGPYVDKHPQHVASVFYAYIAAYFSSCYTFQMLSQWKDFYHDARLAWNQFQHDCVLCTVRHRRLTVFFGSCYSLYLGGCRYLSKLVGGVFLRHVWPWIIILFLCNYYFRPILEAIQHPVSISPIYCFKLMASWTTLVTNPSQYTFIFSRSAIFIL